MSSVLSEESALGQHDVAMIRDFAREPSYISEIARKLIDANLPFGYNYGELEGRERIVNTWGDMTVNGAVRFVGPVLWFASEDKTAGNIDRIEKGYDVDSGAGPGQSQAIGSPHEQIPTGDDVDEKRWNDYVVYHNTEPMNSEVGVKLVDEGWSELASRIRDRIDPSVSVSDKLNMIDTVSRGGNDQSKLAERVAQSVLQRQFRYYDNVEFSDYNDPGVDFYVQDERDRQYGLSVEVSTRWVNPVDQKYFDAKKKKANDRDSDLVILAPKFTQSLLEEYENPDDEWWHRDPFRETVHLHRLPVEGPTTYRPFAKRPDRVAEFEPSGNPVIVPDDLRVQDKLSGQGHVAPDYPVASSDVPTYRQTLDDLLRDHTAIPESVYRSQMREQLEPLFPNFIAPYKIEQFLIDTYWDKGLSQSEIGALVDRTSGTIGEWMSTAKWDIITRGSGAPELTEDTIEIWSRMYNGEEPFVESDGTPIEHSGYRIQAEYNRHPFWTLDDWAEYYGETTERERLEASVQQDDYREKISYTILLGPEDRIQPSYSFIIATLKRNGVEVRPPDEAPRGSYQSYANRSTMEYMINRDAGTVVEDDTEESP